MLQKSLVNHVNDLPTCQANIIVAFGWYCFEHCLNTTIYIKACLKITCLPPCTPRFTSAYWGEGGRKTEWKRWATSILTSHSLVDSLHWNKSDSGPDQYRVTSGWQHCAGVQNSCAGQVPYTGNSILPRIKKITIKIDSPVQTGGIEYLTSPNLMWSSVLQHRSIQQADSTKANKYRHKIEAGRDSVRPSSFCKMLYVPRN